MSSMGRVDTPAWARSRSRKVMPACLGASASSRVRTRQKIQSLASAWEVQTFWPDTRQPPSSAGSARVRKDARSEPASGSE